MEVLSAAGMVAETSGPDAVQTVSREELRRAQRLLWRISGWVAGLLAGAALWAAICPPWRGLALLSAAALLSPLAGLAGTARMLHARRLVAAYEADGGMIGRAARLPQVARVASLAAAAVVAAWLAPAMAWSSPIAAAWVLGASAVAAFGLLIGQRHLAALPAPTVPEAAALARLLAVPVGTLPLLALLQLAMALGLGWAGAGAQVAAVGLGLLGTELAARALARLFLPPPVPRLARAVVDTLLLRAVGRTASDGLAAPLRQNFGLDFSRSWALSYARAALPPLLGLLLLGCWGLTGVVVVPADRRAVEERFGAPARVLHPGLHTVLPWPLGRALPVEFGPVHGMMLSGQDAAIAAAGAEAEAPVGADRLWEQAHPGELLFLIAGRTGARQDFQVVSADIRILYRVGLSDAAARAFVRSIADPPGAVRSAAGRAVAAAFARRTLDGVLGERRTALADELRADAQAELDRFDSGLELVRVVIEAIHPPAGAAGAYHGVQAAGIRADTAISTERGRAHKTLAIAAERATTLDDAARAGAAEITAEARAAAVRFTADRDAAAAGGPAFLRERYYENLVPALQGTPKTVIDHRLGGREPAVIDLRPLVPGSPAIRGED